MPAVIMGCFRILSALSVMIFNSATFLLFFLVFLVAYALTSRQKRLAVCLLASYLFYGWWDWRFLGLILLSTVVDFCVGILLEKAKSLSSRRLLLLLSLLTNLGLLGFFKYANFFIDSANVAMASVGVSLDSLNIILPVGISFYTFQTLSYSIDVYRGVIPSERNFLRFATYVAFFPQLVAGPIVRAKELLPQFHHDQNLRFDNFRIGLGLMIVGFFKKVVVADSLAPFVDLAFKDPQSLNSISMALAVVLYAFQIYCDFSGYSDIAIGIARILGFEFPVNFRMPYFSQSFSEFWQRWHITLSQWLRDYLYIPLGGNRGGFVSTCRNLMLTMLLGGLWHGASWTFVVWGALHGFYLIAQRIMGLRLARMPSLAESRIVSACSVCIVFLLTCLAWIFFRSETFEQAFAVIQVITFEGNWNPASVSHKVIVGRAVLVVMLLLAGELLTIWRPRVVSAIVDSPYKSMLVYSLIISLIFLLGTFDGNQFIYFQF